MQETWCPDDRTMEDFLTFNNTAKKGMFGRAAGGLATLVAVYCSITACEIGHPCPGILSVMCSIPQKYGHGRGGNNQNEALIIINTYFQPGAAQVTQLRDLSSLVELFSRTYPTMPIIIMGDFNARLGSGDQEKFLDDPMLESLNIPNQVFRGSF